jgi:hypothetical protein
MFEHSLYLSTTTATAANVCVYDVCVLIQERNRKFKIVLYRAWLGFLWSRGASTKFENVETFRPQIVELCGVFFKLNINQF